MISHISNETNNELRNGNPIYGLKLLIADNIKAFLKDTSETTIDSAGVNGDKGFARFIYKNKRIETIWSKYFNKWLIDSYNIINKDTIVVNPPQTKFQEFREGNLLDEKKKEWIQNP